MFLNNKVLIHWNKIGWNNSNKNNNQRANSGEKISSPLIREKIKRLAYQTLWSNLKIFKKLIIIAQIIHIKIQ